ncbi:MAG: hypothetical protein IKE60_11240, partial [Reyranella sp.]|uniref:hypothetical protein n=1 Tax=Reyranella sp. TaxID=1929291 RepID=UPI0025EC430C
MKEVAALIHERNVIVTALGEKRQQANAAAETQRKRRCSTETGRSARLISTIAQGDVGWPTGRTVGGGGRLAAAPGGRVGLDGKFFVRDGKKFRVQGVTYGPFAPNPSQEPFPRP